MAAAAVAALHLSINSSVSQSVGHGGRRTRVDGRRLADLGKVKCGGSVPPGCEGIVRSSAWLYCGPFGSASNA